MVRDDPTRLGLGVRARERFRDLSFLPPLLSSRIASSLPRRSSTSIEPKATMNALRTSSESLREKIRDNERLQHLISYLPPLNFITVHYAYFIIICLITSLIFWGSSDPSRSITYTDSLFLVVSAMTEAGLNTVNLSQMTTFQQFLLWFLIMIGGSIWVSIGTVLTRKRVFESRFKGVVRELKERGRGRSRRGSMSMARGTSESGVSGTTVRIIPMIY